MLHTLPHKSMKRYAHHHHHLLLFIFYLTSINGSLDLPKAQLEALRSLAENLPASSTGRSWNATDNNPCLWPGVRCSPDSSPLVTDLTLATGNASGSALFRLLRPLDSLRSLNLSSNRFSGPLPDLSGFPNLHSLDLSYNLFNGTLVSQFQNLTLLESLNLSSNSFSGAVPARGIATGHLRELVLSRNQFSGGIPDEISRFGNLTVLDLSQNSLNGSVPDGIGSLSKLKILLLSANFLDGKIPGELSKIKTLSRFAANLNGFTGTVPIGITSYLQTLDLSFNRLSGEISPELFSPQNLESVDLSSNAIGGQIPVNLSRNLFRLRLGGNSFNGSIPATIGSLSRLTGLELYNNQLDSEIPPQLSQCKNLTLLDLGSNRLHGELPKELGGLQQLVILKLQMNKLKGEIPVELFKLVNLITLNLRGNSLNGEINSAVSALQKLSVLNLEYNELNGPLPNNISSLKSLIELQLAHNKLSGTIPRMPIKLGTTLNLSSNLFNGPIPSYLDELSGLEILDLSNNNLTGEVPYSLTQMQSLTQLVLSNNQLSGILPRFSGWVAVSITGNPSLVAESTETPEIHSKKKNSPILYIVVAISSAIVGLGFVAAFLTVLVSKRFYRVEDEGENPFQVIRGCFLTTNSIHCSSIDFAKAMEAVADPNNITLKTRFSTYYKAAMPSGACYSVKKHNWCDGVYHGGRHGRFGRELEVLGRLSSSNVMVPLAYVLTKDSAYFFYEHIYKGTVFDFLHNSSENALDWPCRYSIALGVAQGLAFLHGCNQPVLLLDLTTKSIHLKCPKEPQIGDIELCKVIDPSKSTGSLSTVAGSVGYIPPEYAYTMRVTAAGNVYSFGVILLELLTGQPPVSEGIELAKRALSYSGRIDGRDRILDPRISRSSLAIRSQMLSAFKVALECVSLSPNARPKMRNALRMLFNAR